MSRMCVVILWSSITFFKGKASCRENEVSAIPGCNATLEWRIGSDYAEALAHSVKVFNAKGIQIAEKEGNKCKNVSDTSTYCGVRNTSSKEWLFSVVLFNVTQENSGNYTGQIKFGPNYEANITTLLGVIDKPEITGNRLPILNESFHITCAVEREFKDNIYKWKINGTDLNSTERIRTESSNLTFERITVVDRFTIFSCRVCTDINCCIESGTYEIDPLYGPDNMTLSLSNSHIYLKLNETFKVMCSAKCNPACTIFWKGSMGSENETLVINSFNSSMAGEYICIAKNNKTGVTVKSDSIFLYVQDASTVSYSHGDNGVTPVDRGKEDPILHFLGIGLVIVAVSLVIVGVLMFVIHMRKSATKPSICQTMHKPCSGPSNSELQIDILTSMNHRRPLPTPAVQESVCMLAKRPRYPTVSRKSMSLQTLFDHNQSSWSPVRQSLSLQTLIQISHTIGQQTNSDNLLSKPYCSEDDRWFSFEGKENAMKLEEQYLKVRRSKKVSNSEQNPGAISLNMKHLRLMSFEQEPQEDLYSTMDETNFSVYDYPRANKEENIENNYMDTEDGNYNYDYAILPGL